ncbi:MAG: hypothetical protein LBF05_01800, partial [Tannerella sp.]|nr:hypothetical protein [Tannerella sp.]
MRPQRTLHVAPEERLVGAVLNSYIEKEFYWVLHAPRQTGKTTFLINWMRELNSSGKYVACYVSVETTQETEVNRAIPLIKDAVRFYAKMWDLPVPSTDNVEPESLLNNIM